MSFGVKMAENDSKIGQSKTFEKKPTLKKVVFE